MSRNWELDRELPLLQELRKRSRQQRREIRRRIARSIHDYLHALKPLSARTQYVTRASLLAGSTNEHEFMCWCWKYLVRGTRKTHSVRGQP